MQVKDYDAYQQCKNLIHLKSTSMEYTRLFFNILLTSTHRKYKARQSSHISFNCSYLTSFSSIFYFPKVQIGISGSQAFALKLSGEFYLDNSPSLLGGTKTAWRNFLDTKCFNLELNKLYKIAAFCILVYDQTIQMIFVSFQTNVVQNIT